MEQVPGRTDQVEQVADCEMQSDLPDEQVPSKIVQVEGIADSGAQSDVWSMKEFLRAGFSEDDLHPVTMSLNAANKSPIKINGAFFATVLLAVYLAL